MKIFKNIFLLLLVLFVTGAIYLSTLDGYYNVKRSRIIKAKPEVVFNDLNDFKNWKEWAPWYEKDSTMQFKYSENTIGVGGSYSWTGEQDVDGFIKTLQIEQPGSIDQEITFKTQFGEMESDVYWRLENLDEGVKVTWGMKGEMNFFYRFMVKDMVGRFGLMEEKGLELLDENIQKKIRVFSIESDGIVEYSGGFYLYISTSSKISEMDSKFVILLSKLESFIETNKVRTTGSPFTIYHKFDELNDATMFSVCMPI